MSKRIYQVSKVLLKNSIFLIFITFKVTFASDIPELTKLNNYALITNQESNSLDIIDLNLLKKIQEIPVGDSPVGIIIDQEKKIAYVTNPKDDNITEIDFINRTKNSISAGKNPLGIALSNEKKFLFVTNWYDNTISVIDIKSKMMIKKIQVGKNPAGILVHKKSGDIIVCNRGSNNIMIIDNITHNVKKTINVGKSPFGIFFNESEKKIFVANVQSNSISIIRYDDLITEKTIEVGEWPYHVAHDVLNNKILISNQRENSITILDSISYSFYKKINEICEYPEGISIDDKKEIAIVACWFGDEVVILNLLDYTIKNRIPSSGGPRGFGNFILKN